jgi:hypothetical protein
VEASDYEALGGVAQGALEMLVGAAALESFKVDAYIVPRCEPGHALYDQFVELRDWTEKAWQTPRDKKWKNLDDVSKGYVEVLS